MTGSVAMGGTEAGGSTVTGGNAGSITTMAGFGGTAMVGGAGSSGSGGSSGSVAGGAGGTAGVAAGGTNEGGAGGTGGTPTICPGPPYAESPLPVDATAMPVCSGMIFTEGPVWFASLGKLFFSNFVNAGDFAGGMMEFTPGGTCDEFAPDLGTNGLAIALDGNILAGRQLTRSVSTINPLTKEVVDVISEYMGQAFSAPNDLTVRSDGNIYFSDPAWNLGPRPEELPQALYRQSPQGDLTSIELVDRRPNGVTLSPDENTLYLAVIGPDETLAFDVAADGTLSNQRQFLADGSDGMAVDCAGNLYLTGNGSVRVYDPAGTSLGTITVPDISGPDPTNVAFGGPERKTLYITGAEYLRSVELLIPGYPY